MPFWASQTFVSSLNFQSRQLRGMVCSSRPKSRTILHSGGMGGLRAHLAGAYTRPLFSST